VAFPAEAVVASAEAAVAAHFSHVRQESIRGIAVHLIRFLLTYSPALV
jgi:hypothetical protein